MKAKLARLLAVLVALTMVVPVSAISGPDEPAASGVSGIYIVQLKDAPLPAYEGNIAGLQATSTQMTGAVKLDVNAPASVRYINYLKTKQAEFLTNAATTIGRKPEVAFQYQLAMNGMAVRLTAAEAAELAKLDGVTAVVPDWVEYAQTDNGPIWIGADEIWDGSATGVDTKGEGMIIGIVDTGINMDHPSFADVGGDGYDHTNPRGTFYGYCDPANTEVYTTAVTCNDKLIGVWSFDADLPEDYNGHGSHVASTAAGNVITAVAQAPTTAVTRTISGVAPHANIIAYSIEGTPGSGSAPGSSIAAAFEQVIADGVDVVNYSFGGSTAVSPWTTEGLIYFYVRYAGIFMTTSAGNTGPTPGSTSNKAAPWYLSVANSTHDRKLENGLIDMEGGTTPPDDMMGLGFSAGYGPAPIVYAGWYASVFTESQTIPEGTFTPAQLATMCLVPFPAGTFDGEIVVCERGYTARVAKGYAVLMGGAGGMVLLNNAASGNSLVGDAHYLPAVHLTYNQGLTLKGWLTDTVVQTGTIMGFSLNIADANGDIMSASSSRGPSSTAPTLLKPDVTAPGTDILAAVADGDNTPDDEAEFDFYSGTSMASPHAAGAAALVIKLHPDWTMAEVQSALMSTALSNGTRPVKENGTTLADPFDVGAGRIDVAQAAQAGFVLHQGSVAMWYSDPAAGGDPTKLNLASLANDHCIQGAPCVWTRTLRGVVTTTWEVSVVNPTSVTLTVEPTNFTLTPGATQVVTITADVAELPLDKWAFGKVQFTPDVASTAVPAHFPVALKTTFAVVPAAVGTETGDAAGSLTVSGIQVSSVITELTAREYGLVQPTLTMEYLNQDSNPDNISLGHNPADGLLVVTAVVTDTDQRFVAEILSSTSDDLDLFVYMPGYGYVCQSATGAVLEYCSVNNPPAGMYYIIVQNYAASVGVDPTDPMTWDPVVLATAVVPGATSKLTAPTSDNFVVTGPSGEIPSGQVFSVEANWDFTVWEANNFGVPNVWYGTFDLGTDPAHPGNIGTTSVDIVHAPAVRLEKTVTTAHTPVLLGDTVTYTLKLYAEEAATVFITDVLPSGVIGTDVYTTVVVTEGTLSGIPVWELDIPVTVGADDQTLYGATIINTAYLGWAGTVQSVSASFTVDLAKLYLPLVMRAYAAP